MDYYIEAINEHAGRELCRKVGFGTDGKLIVTASRKVTSIAQWSALLSACRAVLGTGCGALVEWHNGGARI